VAGIRQTVKEQLDRTDTSEEILGYENIFLATDIIGEASRTAFADAQRWLAQQEQIAALKVGLEGGN
jgi:hypothetical protein